MSMASTSYPTSYKRNALLGVAIMIMVSISPIAITNEMVIDTDLVDQKAVYNTGTVEPWIDGGQPWPQSGRVGERTSEGPAHGPNGGAGTDIPDNASELASVVDPVVNWVYGNYAEGTDALGTPIGDFSNQIVTDESAIERCGGDSLFTVIVQTDVGGNDHSIVKIIEGEDADLAWEVDLGLTDLIKASPVIVDVDEDGMQELILVYDAGGEMYVDAYSPRLYCSVTGWAPGGEKSGELLWSWNDENLRISNDATDWTTSLGGHRPTTQPLLADLDLDGDAELVLAAVDNNENPVVVALPLEANGVPTPIWQSTLGDGTYPSDPSFAQVDDQTAYILLTTINENSGAMWVWKLDSSSGDQTWSLSLSNLDGETNAPHIRLPGPVITNLDTDSTPEMIVTIPTDADGSTSIDGAEFRGLEIDDGSQIWSFEAVNGFTDAPPLAIDTDDDGVIDRVCWVSWYQETTARHGHAGCHDISGNNPQLDWYHDLEQSSGSPNDEIAVAQPIWMDIDGSGMPEVLVAYGRTLWAWDGDTGTQVAINDNWNNEVEVDHRTWSSPALADVDGDATLDIVLADTIISTAIADIRPLLDGRAIEFNPSAPDPGEEVTVTAFFENAGTSQVDRPVDAVLYANGEEIARYRADTLQPTGPTGSGAFDSFSVEWSGSLGDHEFELIVDPYQNVTQSRYDNDGVEAILSVVQPYNATFEIPTEPTRVDPGSYSIAYPTVRSTGRLAGTWSLTIDSTQLPDGWSWTDQTAGGINGIEIGVGETWIPELRINSPADAPGSDTGSLLLILTLDSDSNITVSATLPIEANRTRGLSIRGPSGIAESTGYGLIGDTAKAWLIVENLGNADENSIVMGWETTDWDENNQNNELTLYDENDNQIPALTLEAGESKIITARLGVPSDANLGDEVTTPLSMCVGFGEDETCQNVQLNFVASGVVTESDHQRSMPENTLTWNVKADMPNDSATLEWSLSEAGMDIEDWAWTSSGALSLNSDTLIMTGAPGSRLTGTLTLVLPVDAPPAYHSFIDQSNVGIEHTIRLSVEVLQIYRATLVLISPNEDTNLADVETAIPATVRLYNPGNGDDSYSMSYEVILDSNLSEDPGVEVTFSSEIIQLGAGSLRTLPLQVILPESTPARTPVNISITMNSQGDANVFSTIYLILEARQDHRWEIDTNRNDVLVNEGDTFSVLPGNTFAVEVSAKNVGNLVDDLSINGTGTVFETQGDTSDGWRIIGSSTNNVAVNDTGILTLTIEVPSNSWNGTRFSIYMIGISFDEEVYSLSFTLEVAHVTGWNAIAVDTNLEIDPAGSTVSLSVIQLGNSPSEPFVSVYVTGENGWEITAPESMPTLDPGESAPLELDITPPFTARHGKTVELHVRLREGDGSTDSTITLPLRVAVIHDFTLSSNGAWIVSENGGFPLAELQNNGNAPTTISLEVLSLPIGWNISGITEVVLGVNEIRGVPIDLIPSSDWDGSVKTIRILAQDPEGNQREIAIDTQKEDHSWATSPVIIAMEGDSAMIQLYGTSPSSNVLDDSQGLLEWDIEGAWAWNAIENQVGSQLTVDSLSVLPYSANINQPSSRSAYCSLSGIFGDVNAECSIGNGTETFHYTIMLIDDQGRMIDSKEGIVGINQSLTSVNLSAELWNPDPGLRKLSLRMIDVRGVLMTNNEKSFEIRNSEWNVGLVGIEFEGQGDDQKLKILTKRQNEHLLDYADCNIAIAANPYNSIHSIDMTVVYSPTLKIDRPDNIEDGTELVAEISCEFPWDLDSDPSDDEVRIILSGGSVDNADGFEWITTILSSLMVISLAFVVRWIINNQRERRRLIEMTDSVIKERISKQKKEKIKEIVEHSVINTENTIENNDNSAEEEIDEKLEEEYIEDSKSDDFESRLKRLTGE
tara:strand:+ start:8573 stop:14245 length:5673 start_codon:yes stop_codon:yes gene_type:complete